MIKNETQELILLLSTMTFHNYSLTKLESSFLV